MLFRSDFLSDHDEVRFTVFEDHPGVGLDPDPHAGLGQQPEDRQAALSRLDHWAERREQDIGRRKESGSLLKMGKTLFFFRTWKWRSSGVEQMNE